MKKSTLIVFTSIALMITALPFISMQGQSYDYQYLSMYFSDEREIQDFFINMVSSDMASRHQGLKVLSSSGYLLDEDDEQLWTNGICLYSSAYDSADRKVYFQPILLTDKHEDVIHLNPLNVKGRSIVLSNRPDVKVTVEQVAGHIILVGRNAQGAPVMVLQHVSPEQINDASWTALAQLLILGNYSTSDGSNVVFGPKWPFYVGDSNHTDPGILNGYYIFRDLKSMNILYGNRRVSRGNPSDPKWGKMPGGGGVAAIMGPMEWNIVPTIDGLQVIIVHDEKFVLHMPSIGNEGDTVCLTKVQTPFVGLDGKWAFASVFPLNETLLKLFPKQVLTLIRGEIFARYGDTFKNPETQRYFDAQPWYKRLGNQNIRLTDVERFNNSLIKQVEASQH